MLICLILSVYRRFRQRVKDSHGLTTFMFKVGPTFSGDKPYPRDVTDFDAFRYFSGKRAKACLKYLQNIGNSVTIKRSEGFRYAERFGDEPESWILVNSTILLSCRTGEDSKIDVVFVYSPRLMQIL